MLVNSIEKGIVIDHITAGLGAKILEYLDIDLTTNTVAFIMNACSKKHGKKDIVKIQNVIDVNLDVLGLIEPNATVNVIENGEIVRKIALQMPETVTNVIKCKNPRCVTSVEANAPHIFHLIDADNREYRCEYCDEIVSMKGAY
ncbi:aspartate carbamoyltransferase regulatory subunit [Aminipila terrae]|uniref:aspartate carbamoyltransferase regulatory subunit n=1 Tax=Aminipila terrae TaxID=2697030 RepID=UPI0013907B75|nr:aspartate carbamoyltransferase regulatory subunit [Aminipila terrae]